MPFSNVGHLDCHYIGTCAMQARIKNIITILTNATKGCATKFYYFCEVACANLVVFEMPKGVHYIIQSDLEFDVIMGNSLLDMYANYAIKMPSQDKVIWITMILGHVKCEQGALELF